jgi:hypothetical protein
LPIPVRSGGLILSVDCIVFVVAAAAAAAVVFMFVVLAWYFGKQM